MRLDLATGSVRRLFRICRIVVLNPAFKVVSLAINVDIRLNVEVIAAMNVVQPIDRRKRWLFLGERKFAGIGNDMAGHENLRNKILDAIPDHNLLLGHWGALVFGPEFVPKIDDTGDYSGPKQNLERHTSTLPAQVWVKSRLFHPWMDLTFDAAESGAR